MGNKRKTSFLRKILDKLNPNTPIEPEDPGEEVSVSDHEQDSIEPNNQQNEQQNEEQASVAAENTSFIGSAIMNASTVAGSITVPEQPQRPRSTELELAQELRTAFELYSKVS